MIPSAEAIIMILQTLAVPTILLLFYLDGMVVGKLTPPAALFIAYIVVVSPPYTTVFIIAVLSTIAATLGQFTLYHGFNTESPDYIGIGGKIPYVGRIPAFVTVRIGKQRMQFVSRLFDRFGGTALAVTNAIPGIRSLMSVPAGLSQYSARRFLLFSGVGNGLYLVLLTAVAWGIVDVAAHLPWV